MDILAHPIYIYLDPVYWLLYFNLYGAPALARKTCTVRTGCSVPSTVLQTSSPASLSLISYMKLAAEDHLGALLCPK